MEFSLLKPCHVSCQHWNFTWVSHYFTRGRTTASRKDSSMISLAIYRLLPGLVPAFLSVNVHFPMTSNSNDWQLSKTMLTWTLLNKKAFFASTSKYLIAYWYCQPINKVVSFPGCSAQVILTILYRYSRLQVTFLRNWSIWETSRQIILDHGNDKVGMYYQ